MTRKSILNCFSLTVISFFLITKWWYVLVIDGTDEIMYGFPFIYTCRGFHTSLSSQYFLLEFTIDFLLYFGFWLTLNYLFSKYLFPIKLNKTIRSLLFMTCGLILLFQILMNHIGENYYSYYREFEYTYFTSGVDIFGKENKRPNYDDFVK